MNMFTPLRRVALLFSSLVLLGLSACATATPTPPKEHTTVKGRTTHTITIHYDAAAQPQWSYTIHPANNDALNARVKRHDTILWRCDSGTWTVYFKGPTPLTKPADPCEGDLGYVSGAAGVSAGGEVAARVEPGDVFTYGVSLLLPGASEPVVDDPRIIIER